jgi:hypothetical protein
MKPHAAFRQPRAIPCGQTPKRERDAFQKDACGYFPNAGGRARDRGIRSREVHHATGVKRSTKCTLMRWLMQSETGGFGAVAKLFVCHYLALYVA